MLKKLLTGAGLTALLATAVLAQDTAPRGAAAAARGAGRVAPGTVAAGVRVDPNTPTEAQWAKPEAQAYVAKAKELAGNDPDLQYDASFNCTAAGTHAAGGGGARMTVGDGAYLAGSPIPFVEMPEKTTMLPAQHFFDNFWRFGGTGVGAWLITTPKRLHPVRHAGQCQGGEGQYRRRDGQERSRPQKDQIHHLRPLAWRSYRRRPLHAAADRRAGACMGRDDWELYYKMMSATRRPVDPAGRQGADDAAASMPTTA